MGNGSQLRLVGLGDRLHQDVAHHSARRPVVGGTGVATPAFEHGVGHHADPIAEPDQPVAEGRLDCGLKAKERNPREEDGLDTIGLASGETKSHPPAEGVAHHHGGLLEGFEKHLGRLRVPFGAYHLGRGRGRAEPGQVGCECRKPVQSRLEIGPAPSPTVQCQDGGRPLTEDLGEKGTICI